MVHQLSWLSLTVECSLVSCVVAPLQVRRDGEQIKWEGEKSKNCMQWINGGWEQRWRGTLRCGGLDCWGRGDAQTDRESRQNSAGTHVGQVAGDSGEGQALGKHYDRLQKAAAMVGGVKTQATYSVEISWWHAGVERSTAASFQETTATPSKTPWENEIDIGIK